MNIGVVCYPTYGGSGVVATELGKRLAAQGHNIHFITYSRPIRLDLFSENIFYHEVRTPDYPLFETRPYESALASTMVDVARYHKIDLFHAENPRGTAVVDEFLKNLADSQLYEVKADELQRTVPDTVTWGWSFQVPIALKDSIKLPKISTK